MSDETWQEIIDRLESQNQALQEGLRVLLEDAVYMHKEHGARDDCRAISRARELLSPTQETDAG